MIDISVQNIKKAFEEGNDILDGLTFDIDAGERVGLLGKNGAGKTTLLKIITGELLEDEGMIVIPEAKKIGLISQIPEYPLEYTAEDVLKTAFSHLFQIKEELEQLEDEMKSFDSSGPANSNGRPANNHAGTELLGRYDRLIHDYGRLGGYTTESDLNKVVNGLQIPQQQRTQLFNTLSGGEKTRINLARLILENTDILLLDEPTNHLDLSATIWLEEFLTRFKGTVLVISHDRYFLDKVITRAIEIKDGKAEFYSGNYSYYVIEKQRRYEKQLEIYKREQAEAKRLNDSADRLQQWGFGNSTLMKKSFAVRTRAEKVLKTEKPGKDKMMKVKFSEREFRGDEVLIIKGLTKSYNGKLILDINELLVEGGERIAIIGDNGTGKTTLVKLIMKEEKPDKGFIRIGPAVKSAYLPQIIKFENPNRSIVDTLIYELNESPQTARNRLGAYLFHGEDVFKYVGDLSGGEKSRLRLCMLMNNDINLLILDEPTNHLDLTSREWIESAVAGYEETLLFISHDRYFINRFATRIWSLENGEFIDFKGTYEQYINQTKTKPSSAPANRAIVKTSTKNTASPKQTKQKPSLAQKELRRVERDIENLENEIEHIEMKKSEYATDYEKLMELDEHETALKNQLDELLDDWERSLSACEGLR
ncbi:MAG: ABC-F family ATP-binding cassette domain-containing protein [Oscillospiraceae bacterium]|nr:ABC-F family ATP-binding cassette domain-containing protein [Oscillospiraceae bacterium]